MAAVEEDYDIISDEEEDLEELEELESELEEESDVEEESEAEADSEAEEEEEIEESESEAEEEEEDESEPEEEEDELSFKDVYQEDEPAKATRRQKTRIERYCKSLNETNPRDFISKESMPSHSYQVLKGLTTEKNALAFSSYVSNRRQLYQLASKMLTKELGNKELFQELKAGVSEWQSAIYRKRQQKEQLEIRIMTTKMDVVEGLYTCKRCGSGKTYSRQVQTRSADEGMTSIIQCSKCSLVWREYA